jgi:hypothetical protein
VLHRPAEIAGESGHSPFLDIGFGTSIGSFRVLSVSWFNVIKILPSIAKTALRRNQNEENIRNYHERITYSDPDIELRRP